MIFVSKMTDEMDRHWKIPEHLPSDQYGPQTPLERFLVFIDHRLEHLSIKEFWLRLVLADNGIDDYKYRNLRRCENHIASFLLRS
jgi:hypothetical protein